MRDTTGLFFVCCAECGGEMPALRHGRIVEPPDAWSALAPDCEHGKDCERYVCGRNRCRRHGVSRLFREHGVLRVLVVMFGVQPNGEPPSFMYRREDNGSYVKERPEQA